ncbi:MAG: radical SAM protein [Dissulfuribacterales bacterium]
MEIERRTVQFQANTRNLFFHILTQCNLRCRHCYINPEQHGSRILDERTLAEWLAIFAGNCKIPESLNHRITRSPGNTNVIFLGGEPTLSPALPHAIREARRLGYASITVDTNGYLFNDVLDRVSPEELDYFSFSLDGSRPEVNDFIRGEGVFDTCTSGVRRALEKGFGVSVIFTASRMNIHDLVNMPPLLTGLGVKRFFIQVIGIRGKPARRGETSLQLSRGEWETVVPEVARKAAEKGLHVTYPKVFLKPDEPFACAGLVADNYFVFPNGRVYTCPLCEDYPIHSMEIVGGVLKERPPIRECDLYQLRIAEGCVLNRILHPGNISYDPDGRPVSRIACCMLKEEVLPAER